MKIMNAPAGTPSAGPVGAPAPPRPTGAPSPRWREILPWAAPAGALALGWWSLATTPHPDAVGGLGLITLLPLGAWVALAILFASFGVTAAQGRFTGGRAVLHLAALVLLLHGAPALLYRYPRFT